MPDYNPGLLFQGLNQGLAAFADAQEEQKTRAREFKALQEFADATGIADKNQTTVLDLESLKGLVRGAEGKRAMDEQRRKATLEQAQFDELKKYRQSELSRNLGNDAWRMGTDIYDRFRNARTDDRLERSTALAEKANADTLKRLATQQQEAEAQRAAVGGLVRDFNQFAEGPQFNGTGMQRPMGQFEAYRRALGQNPRAVTEEMVLGLGRMAVSEDRLGKPGAATSEPSIFVSPNGRTYIRHGNNPLVRDKTDEEIEAELAAKSAPRAMAPEGSVEGNLNGVKVLIGPDGRIYKLPSANPLAELLNRAGAPAAAPSPTWGDAVSNWLKSKGSSAPATNAPPAAPSGAPVVRWGLDANGNPVKLR